MSRTFEEFYTVRCQVTDMKDLFVSFLVPFSLINMLIIFFLNIDFPVKMYYNLKRFQLWNIMCFTTLPTCWEGVG